jgi:hypothetical protein
MPKARPPFDTQRYESLKAQGLSQRVIAEQMGMPEATLRNNLKVLAQAVARTAEEDIPIGNQGLPIQEHSEVHLGNPEVSHIGLPEGDNSTPPLYIHRGISDDGEESPVGAEDIEGVHEGIPPLPMAGIQQGAPGRPEATLSPELVEALRAAWPDLARMLEWWRMRQAVAQEPPEKLERATYHIAPRWIEAIRREADLTGESYAAVVNRALRQYFDGKST